MTPGTSQPPQSGPAKAFFALDVGPQAQATLRRAQMSLASPWPASVLFVPETRLHITLRFLGNLNPQMLTSLTNLPLEYHAPFILGLDGSGSFPDTIRPNVLWAGVGGQMDELNRLQAFVDGAATALGIPTANYPFSPHITLGYLSRWPTQDQEAEPARASLAARRAGWPFRDPQQNPHPNGRTPAQHPWSVSHLQLMCSAHDSGPNPGDAPYQTLFSCPMGPASSTHP